MIIIIDCGYKYLHRLEDLVNQYIDYQTIPVFDFDIKDIGVDIKGVIISSTQLSVHQTTTDNYQNKLSPIFDLDLPVLGIGVGHHLLGLCFEALTAYQP